MIWALTIIIIGLIGLIAWEKYQGRKERAKLINALIGKNAQEIASLELADNTKIESKPVDTGLIYPQESGNITDEQFDKVIDETNG